MRATVLKEIMDGVDFLPLDDNAKLEVKRLVSTIGIAHGVRGLDWPVRIAFARRLLAAKASRPTIRDRLRAAFGISRRQAYRVIDEAVQLCHEHALHGTTNVFNGTVMKSIGGGDE